MPSRFTKFFKFSKSVINKKSDEPLSLSDF
jgi:hypothetical protein